MFSGFIWSRKPYRQLSMKRVVVSAQCGRGVAHNVTVTLQPL